MDISEKIKKRRFELGLTAKDVAMQLNVAESTYRDWENGRKIQGEPYVQLSKILNLPLASLFGIEQSSEVIQLKMDIDQLSEQVNSIRSRLLSLI